MPSITPETLESFAIQLLAAGGLGAEEAAIVGKSLVGANLRGHDSHGVMRIPYYLDEVKKGNVKAGADLTVVKETATSLVTDGHWGLGQPLAQRLTQKLIEKAKATSAVVGTLVHSSHVGRLGEYCEMSAAEGLVSIIMVNTHGNARRVAPPGGKAPRLGTNPLAIGVPRGDAPLVLDFGTSATAEGKVRVKKIAGQKVPEGWLLDCDGKPTTDPNTLYGNPPGTILPMGGDQAYKGFALGLMVEIFASALSGGPCIREVPINQNGNCMFMMLVNPANLAGQDHFTTEVANLAEFIVGCPRIEGIKEILLPGDPERRVFAQRMATGVPLDDGNWNELLKLADKLQVKAPAAA